MNHINCKLIALERFFSQRSDSLVSLDDFTEEDLENRLSLLPVFSRVEIAHALLSGLRELRGRSGVFGCGIIPREVEDYAPLSLSQFMRGGHLLTALKWLRGVQLTIEQNRVEWLSRLKTVSARYSAPLSSFIQTFFALSNQRVFIAQKNDSITLHIAEREWGLVAVRFDCCEPVETPDMPLPGYAVATEAEVMPDGRLSFTMLIDTYFGDSVFADRLLSDDGWQTLRFVCRNIDADFTFIDYAGRLTSCGTPKADMLEAICRILISKKLIIGEDGMNSAERAMLPAAVILGGFNATHESDLAMWQCEEMLIDAMNNRFAMEQLLKTVDECGVDMLTAQLRKAIDACYDNHDNDAVAAIKVFVTMLNSCIADGTARPLLHRLCAEFSRASKLNTGSTARTCAEKTALSCIKRSVDPMMDSLGFTGLFPNFRRKSQKKYEYVSFMLDPSGDRVRHGVLSFTASVAAAETDAQRLDSCKIKDFRTDDTTALDCLAEAFSASHYGEMCCIDDNKTVGIDINIYENSEKAKSDCTAELLDHLKYAEHQFDRGVIPAEYRRQRHGFPGVGSAFFRAMWRYMYIAVSIAIAVLALYLAFGSRFGIIAGRGTVIAAALCAGLAADLIAGVVYCIKQSFTLWRY